jgi:hypothetical protein
MIEKLGLKCFRRRKANTPDGIHEFGMYETVRLTIQGRECRVEVCEVDESCGVLIGQLPLEALDFVVDPVGRKLVGNPFHGGEEMVDLL